MLKLKLQYFGHLMQRADSLEKNLMLGGIGAGGEGDDRGWDGWIASLTQWAWVWVNSGSLWWTGRPGVLWFMGSQRVRNYWATELNWTEGFRYADNTTLMEESEEELKCLLMKAKEESEKAGLTFNIQKTKVMASSPITSWQMDEEKWRQWQILFSWAPKSPWMVTATMILKPDSLLGRKVMTNLDGVLQSTDISLPTKVRIVKTMVFPVVMYGCESWTIK